MIFYFVYGHYKPLYRTVCWALKSNQIKSNQVLDLDEKKQECVILTIIARTSRTVFSTAVSFIIHFNFSRIGIEWNRMELPLTDGNGRITKALHCTCGSITHTHTHTHTHNNNPFQFQNKHHNRDDKDTGHVVDTVTFWRVTARALAGKYCTNVVVFACKNF